MLRGAGARRVTASVVRAPDGSVSGGGGSFLSKCMFFYDILCVKATPSRRNGPPTKDAPPCAREPEASRAESDP